MIAAHVSGEVFGQPERRTSAAGRDWLRVKLRCANGERPVFVSVAVFDAALIDRLADLKAGDSLSVAGPLELRAWSDKEGQPQAGLSLVANAVLTVRDGTRRRAARALRQEEATHSLG